MISVVPPFLLFPWATITMSSHRIERVSELVKREVSEIVQELNLTNCGFITITAAEISPDLKDGRIYLSVIGSAEQKQHALDVLDRQHGHIQRELAHRIVLKYTPRLKFVLDETETRAIHIEHLLNELEGAPPDE
jgi:ribosome-binding factor A